MSKSVVFFASIYLTRNMTSALHIVR